VALGPFVQALDVHPESQTWPGRGSGG